MEPTVLWVGAGGLSLPWVCLHRCGAAGVGLRQGAVVGGAGVGPRLSWVGLLAASSVASWFGASPCPAGCVLERLEEWLVVTGGVPGPLLSCSLFYAWLP